MPTDFAPGTVNHAFFAPIVGLAEAAPNALPCPELPDAEWVRMGIQRVLEAVPSGRAFLQEHAARFSVIPTTSNYFAALHSTRRAALLGDVCDEVLASLARTQANRLAHIPELDSYTCFAVDAHWHSAATHDARYDGKKAAVGHCYSLNLHDHGARHLITAEGEHENDLSMLKRIKPLGLRQGVLRGRRVLVVYDRAGIDYGFWKRCARECAVFFLSRMKVNLIFEWAEDNEWDREDRRNRGVEFDQWVLTPEGHRLRLIEYRDPETGELYIYLTNEKDLPPGVLAELYRRRWEIEKVFDEFKNKLGEKKAWASSQEARTIQGRFVTLTHNLLVNYQRQLEAEYGVINQAEDRRRDERIEQARRKASLAMRAFSTLLQTSRLVTQCSVKYVRWLRHALQNRLAEEAAVPRLVALYATL